MIGTVVFDVYGVLMKESRGNLIPFVQERRPDLELDFVRGIFRLGGLGRLTGQEMLYALGFRGDLAALEREYLDHWLTLDPDALPTLKWAAVRWPLAVLSNDVAPWSRYVLERYDLNRFFMEKVISGDVGLRKPDPAIFELLLRRLGCPAGDCVFIDNSAANLRVARTLGLSTIHFNRDGEAFDGLQVDGFADLPAALEYLE